MYSIVLVMNQYTIKEQQTNFMRQQKVIEMYKSLVDDTQNSADENHKDWMRMYDELQSEKFDDKRPLQPTTNTPFTDGR